MASSPSFTATVSAITDAFGDPTRRGASTCSPATTARCPSSAWRHRLDGGAEVGVHPNVARHRLDKLAAGGYLEVVSGGAPRAPAPAARRSATSVADAGVATSMSGAQRRPGAGAARASARPPAARRGRGDGRGGRPGVRPGDGRRADRRRWPPASASLRSAMQAVADALTAHGFAAHADQAQRPAADHQQPLPVRRRGHRAPGHLRGRPRHGEGDARRAVTSTDPTRLGDVVTESSLPAATRSAPPSV